MLECDYRDNDDVMVDCIIGGGHDKKLQGRLFEKGEATTPTKVIEIGQHFEQSHKQLCIVRDESEVDVEVVWSKKQHVIMKKTRTLFY